MCGITGFYGFEDKDLLKRMTLAVRHRGPDQFGYYTDALCSLGHRRLSILDLSNRGKQPMSNADGTLWITYNGEVYNYRELRKDLEQKGYRFKSNTDTEVILYAYQEYGVECLKLFDGMFAFAIWDTKKKELFLARDRIGIKPLYYLYDGNKLLFASEIKSLCLYPSFKKIMNKQAIVDYLDLRFIPGSQTIFQEVHRLLPGQYMLFSSKGLSLHQYWSFILQPKQQTLSYYVQTLRNTFEDSVQSQMMSDVPIGAFLSGGIDSSAIVAYMAKHSTQPVKTFSVSFHRNNDKELKYARLVADTFQTDHKELYVEYDAFRILPKVVWHMDEPFGDPAAIPTYFLAQETKRYASVVLSGDGPDELFNGYEQYRIMQALHYYKKYIPPLISTKLPRLAHHIPKPILNSFFKYAQSLGKEGIERFHTVAQDLNDPAKVYYYLTTVFTAEEKKELFANTKDINLKQIQDLLNTSFSNAKQREDVLQGISHFDTTIALPDDYLMKVDKMTMAHSLESRVPYLDNHIVELASRIPASFKLRGMHEKFILKQAMKPILPKEIIQRKKDRFFVPIDDWLSKDLKQHAEEMLLHSPLFKNGIFRKEYFEKMSRNFSSSPLYYGRQMWNLLNLHMWHQLYVEKEQVKPKHLKEINI